MRRLLLSIGFGARLLAAQQPVKLSDAVRRGNALFHGKQALSGKIRGHDEFLPAEAVRCANCHDSQDKGGLIRDSAPRLDRSLLLDARQRRGGPPSRYDPASFCKLLRTGIDPASILIAREMPTYELNASECDSLWSFLTREDRDVK